MAKHDITSILLCAHDTRILVGGQGKGKSKSKGKSKRGENGRGRQERAK
ncbi:hypothetical protein COLO4_23529 [Corchorus olitorius]|uniref:Uncharacterized protein n=1 Tax=Corchorus olitorius TaxID=93759 RepID=A0A1R3IG32_9ROSI|nr:hypothetical protein COLO4_23529 [Corchorus olitorius]